MLALERARALGGIVVNADALQVYDGLRVVTARPAVEDEAAVPHRLYGSVAPETRFSTGAWAAAAQELIEQTAATDSGLVFVGGTGLYFAALEAGFADVPEVPAEVTAAVMAEVQGLDAAGRGALIAVRDPLMAERLAAPDPQRVVRALAVLAATGRSLAWFQDQAQQGLLDGFDVERIVLNPARDVLRARIATRFGSMLSHGAVEEVEALLARRLDPSLPAMKAIGVREIGDWLGGRISRDEMIERAVTATRQFAKRQRTWFRGRMADWQWVES